MEFGGYEYFDISNENALFSENELNVLIYYIKPQKTFILYIAIASGVVLLIALAAVMLHISKKRRLNTIDFDE